MNLILKNVVLGLLVVQWLRLCTPMQGTWVRTLVGELDPTPPGDLSNPGIKPMSVALAGIFFTTVTPGKLDYINMYFKKYSFPLWFIIGCCIQFPVLYSRTMLFMASV